MLLSYVSDKPIPQDKLHTLLGEALARLPIDGKRVLAIVPDDTRTFPLREVAEVIVKAVNLRAKELAFLIALGTHPPMTDEQISRHLGLTNYDPLGTRIFQHRWNEPQELVTVGLLNEKEMETLSGGVFTEEVPVRINRRAVDYDFLLVVGPVFPHEAVGFSGGYKYFFPGISGPEMVHQSHWLGALLTTPKVIGRKDTPVRAMIEQAAKLVPTPRVGISGVMHGHDLKGIYMGDVTEAWDMATELSNDINVVRVERQFETVIAIAPMMYRELWTAGKCMYKLDPVVADRGSLVIYAPHIHEISFTHGGWILKTGYHTRDYFLAQWDRFQHIPRAVLAHSTHVKGIGTFRNGIETPRINVVLATNISEEVCQRINLAYRNPASIQLEEFMHREDEGILVVSDAGEILYLMKNGQRPDIDRLYHSSDSFG